MRGGGLRGLVARDQVRGDGERGAEARVVVRPAAAAQGPGEGGGGGSDGGKRGRPLAAGSRGHRHQELGGGEGRGRHLSLPSPSAVRTGQCSERTSRGMDCGGRPPPRWRIKRGGDGDGGRRRDRGRRGGGGGVMETRPWTMALSLGFGGSAQLTRRAAPSSIVATCRLCNATPMTGLVVRLP